jgi:phage terminase small subunit
MGLPSATLTHKQALFVRALAKTGDPTRAAEVAGYSSPMSDGGKLRHLPHVQAALAAELRRFLVTEAAPAALQLLYMVMTDERQPDMKLRIACAKTIADRAGFIPPKAQGDSGLVPKSLAEMDRGELLETAQRIHRELSDRAVTVIDSEPPVHANDTQLADILD